VNVLKPHLQTTVFTLLAAGKSQREIARITKLDRKSIRRLEQFFIVEQANSPGVATGSIRQLPPLSISVSH
jgi:transcriptional regulator